VRLEYRNQDPIVAEKEAHKLFSRFQDLLITDYWKLITIIGPVPCFYAKVGGTYRWQIILRGTDPIPLLRERVIETWLKDWRVEVDPISLL
jgi:primosomal protein N'